MKEYCFEYRRGEITATVKANSLIEALNIFNNKGNIKYNIDTNMLWSDLWTYEGDELSIKLNEELSNKEEDDDEI